MKKIFLLVLSTSLVITVNCKLLTVNYLYAESFKILGSRPLGMGGAFVAIAEDSLAQYWNPAGLAKQKLFDLQAPMNIGAKLTGGILKEAKEISDLAAEFDKIQQAQQGNKSLDQQGILNFYKTLKNINDLNKPGSGALIEFPASLAIRIGRTSWQLNQFTEVGIIPSVDLQNIGLRAISSGGGAILYNSQSLSPSSSFGAITLSSSTLSDIPTNDPISELTSARDILKNAIIELQSIFGVTVSTFAGFTLDQLANALINYATRYYTIDQIVQASKEIESLSNEIRNIFTGAGFFSQNDTKLTLRGASILEISAAYGQPLGFVSKDLLAGVNFKVMRGYIGFNQLSILQQGEEAELDKMLQDYTKYTKESYNFGVDLGLMLDKVRTWRTRIGILARNVNHPKFKQPEKAIETGEGEYYVVKPQYRAGVAFYPLRGFLGWILAADYDLTKNATLVEGYKSQLLSLGTEINLGGRQWFNVALRAGAMKNLAAEKDEITYTGGLGINFLHFQFDLAGAISADRTEIKPGEEYPSTAQVSATLTLNF